MTENTIHVAERDGELDLRFRGRELAAVNDCDENKRRITRLELYETAGGTLVLTHEVSTRGKSGFANWAVAAHPADLVREIVNHFGNITHLCKELLHEAGMGDMLYEEVE